MQAKSPTDAIMEQIETLQDAANILQDAIDELTSVCGPDECTWKDVARFARMVDAAKKMISETTDELKCYQHNDTRKKREQDDIAKRY